MIGTYRNHFRLILRHPKIVDFYEKSWFFDVIWDRFMINRIKIISFECFFNALQSFSISIDSIY